MSEQQIEQWILAERSRREAASGRPADAPVLPEADRQQQAVLQVIGPVLAESLRPEYSPAGARFAFRGHTWLLGRPTADSWWLMVRRTDDSMPVYRVIHSADDLLVALDEMSRNRPPAMAAGGIGQRPHRPV